MKSDVSPLERAFELAKSGKVSGVEEVKDALRREGFDVWSIEGPTLAKQLREIIRTARGKKK